MAHSNDAMAKPNTDHNISGRRPSLAVSQPVIGVTMAVPTTLSVTIQATWSGVADSAP